MTAFPASVGKVLEGQDAAAFPLDTEGLSDIFLDPLQAIHLGRHYLDQHEGKAKPPLEWAALPLGQQSPPSRLAEYFAKTSRRDLQGGKVQLVDGWVMTPTEAGACVWAALSVRAIS
ncbi:hypothetical protein [Telmatospirillum sp. J64-1]|uniref:hypothetical protein n=1 Tax=Telmatospirillum sp. J64-1 TaxID=2502183 RepID=UPI00163D6BC2|nr:hypothetical protein [Telmatospirillum sp. J64-1]